MGRTKRSSSTEPPVLDEQYWLRFGSAPEPSTRERLLYVCIGEMGRRGALDTTARWVCDLAGAQYPLINYYFGSFDGLVAEAINYCYDEWYRTQVESLARPARSARARFDNYINGELARVRRLGAIIPLSSFPVLSETVSRVLSERYPGKIDRTIEWTLLVTAQLIRDLRRGERTEIEFTPETMSRAKAMAKMPRELLAAASAQWSLSGLMQWASGAHLAGATVAELPASFSEKVAIRAHIDRVLDSLEQ